MRLIRSAVRNPGRENTMHVEANFPKLFQADMGHRPSL
jgi:hypothetical protein